MHGIEPSLAQVLNEVLLARLKDSRVLVGDRRYTSPPWWTWSSRRQPLAGVPRRARRRPRGMMDSTISKVGGQFVVTKDFSGRRG